MAAVQRTELPGQGEYAHPVSPRGRWSVLPRAGRGLGLQALDGRSLPRLRLRLRVETWGAGANATLPRGRGP
eukprot:673398-Alexandrium_andersonii.AAC.1